VHQVSAVHTTSICERLGIDTSRVPMTFPTIGNVGPAAIPITLASVQDQIKVGERVLCMGIGSGLNTAATEIVW
jgi:3-oxoacyl-[acyl-carrier-protein] synthase-3